jgi:hypothetical protein
MCSRRLAEQCWGRLRVHFGSADDYDFARSNNLVGALVVSNGFPKRLSPTSSGIIVPGVKND